MRRRCQAGNLGRLDEGHRPPRAQSPPGWDRAARSRAWPTMFRRRAIASDHSAIISPASWPTMAAPRMRPRALVTTLIMPAGMRSVWRAVVAGEGDAEDADGRRAGARASASLSPTRGQRRIGEGRPRRRPRVLADRQADRGSSAARGRPDSRRGSPAPGRRRRRRWHRRGGWWCAAAGRRRCRSGR